MFELASELLLADEVLDVDEAARRQPEIALAEAEAEAYAHATQRGVGRLQQVGRT